MSRSRNFARLADVRRAVLAGAAAVGVAEILGDASAVVVNINGAGIEGLEYSYDDLLRAGVDVVGVSPDSPERNARFRTEGGFPFALLSDPDHAVAAAYGAWGLKKSYGREYEGLIRSTFVIGPDGEIEREYRNVRAKGHVARVTADLLG